MLSRVANRVYWMSRYMERANNTARLIDSTSELVYDLPTSFSNQWVKLISVLDLKKEYRAIYSTESESNVVRFLLNHQSNPNSIVQSIRLARENARGIRDILSREVWEAINELYLEIHSFDEADVSRSQRSRATGTVRKGCQLYLGVLSETLSRNDVYHFCLLGLYIERADMVLRILESQLSGEESLADQDLGAYDVSLWRSFLSSLGAYHMYLTSEVSVVDPDQVLRFMVSSSEFPRSILYCIKNIQRALAKLPKGKKLSDDVARLSKPLKSLSKEAWQMGKAPKDLLVSLADIQERIDETYFELD